MYLYARDEVVSLFRVMQCDTILHLEKSSDKRIMPSSLFQPHCDRLFLILQPLQYCTVHRFACQWGCFCTLTGRNGIPLLFSPFTRLIQKDCIFSIQAGKARLKVIKILDLSCSGQVFEAIAVDNFRPLLSQSRARPEKIVQKCQGLVESIHKTTL